jgi:hypothetical protein
MHIVPDDRRESFGARGVEMRSVSGLRQHPAYAKLRLSVLPTQFAAIKRLGDLALRDPLLVTREGVIIDGYARKAYAESIGISNLPCVELDIDEGEQVRMMLSRHRRSAGWNDYNRIRMASQLTELLRSRARKNQVGGGRLKDQSNLTEANVRKEIAGAADVSEGQVNKFNQIQDSHPEVLNALSSGEIRIHRAWLWRKLPQQEQREELRQHRQKKGLKQSVKVGALKRRVHRSNRVVLTVAKLKELLRRTSLMPSSDQEKSELIEICLIEAPGKSGFLTSELYEALWAEGSESGNGDKGTAEAVS